MAHARVSLHQIAFIDASTSDFIRHCRSLGVRNLTLVTPPLMAPGGLEDARQALATGDVQVAVVNHGFGQSPDLHKDRGEAATKLMEAIDMTATLGGKAIYLLTGGRGALSWEEAAKRFANLIVPARDAARERGIALMVENANIFNADIHIAHTLRDATTLAEMCDIGVCIELHACWPEAGLREAFVRCMPRTGLVQVSDYVLGDRTTPCRAVPGDGVIPLDRLIGDILDAGYDGLFDLELVGPRIEAEGARAASRRAVDHLSELLIRLGA